MKRLPLSLAMLVGTATAAFAQNPSAEPLVIRQPLTQADLANLSSRLLMNEIMEAELRRQFEEEFGDVKNDPGKMMDLIGKLPTPNNPGQNRKQQMPDPQKTPHQQDAPLPRMAGHSQHRAPDRPALQSYPPPLNPALQNNPTVRNFLKLWEKNIGPLEKTPTLKKIFADLLRNSVNNGESGSSGPFGDDAFGSLFNAESPAGREIAEMLEEAVNGSSWNWADLGLDDWKFNLPQSQSYSTGSKTWSPPSAADESLPIPDLLLALAALAIGVIVLRRVSAIRASSAASKTARTIAPPLDPNAIHDRASLVKAFETVTLNAMGREAAAWNHCTIAAELNRRVIVASGTAAEAARLYELARYSPPSEPLPSDSIAQARRCLGLLGEAAAR